MSIDRTLEPSQNFLSDTLPRGVDYIVKNPGSCALAALVGLVAWSAFSVVRAYKAFTKEFEEQELMAQKRVKKLTPFIPVAPKREHKPCIRLAPFKPKLETIKEVDETDCLRQE